MLCINDMNRLGMKEITITDVDELIKKLNNYKNNFAFRGQSDSNWKLTSSLERMVNQSEKNRIYEDFYLNQFRKKFPLYSKDFESPKNKLSWLSLMQHYGVPTRLIDFTTSPFVALYFAIENLNPVIGKYFSIYAVDYAALVKASCIHVGKYNSSFEKYANNFSEQCEEAFESILDKNSYDVLWFVDPMQLNNRIEKQAGTFLISGSFEKTVENLLSLEIYENVEIEKINFPHHLLENIYCLLRKMHLSPQSIYGDLSGLAKEIQLQMKVYSLDLNAN